MCISLSFAAAKVSFNVYVNEKTTISLLNEFENYKTLELKTLFNYDNFYSIIEEHSTDFKVDNVKVEFYLNEHGRECSVLINTNFDINLSSLIYSETFSYKVYVNIGSYASNIVESDNNITFSIKVEDVDYGFPFFDYNLKVMDFYIDKDTLYFVCKTS